MELGDCRCGPIPLNGGRISLRRIAWPPGTTPWVVLEPHQKRLNRGPCWSALHRPSCRAIFRGRIKGFGSLRFFPESQKCRQLPPADLRQSAAEMPMSRRPLPAADQQLADGFYSPDPVLQDGTPPWTENPARWIVTLQPVGLHPGGGGATEGQSSRRFRLGLCMVRGFSPRGRCNSGIPRMP